MRGVIPDIMTVDTEGSDALVLLGAAKTLASGHVGYLEFEYHAIGPWARRALSDVIAYLDNLAFDCWWAGQGQTFRITGCWDSSYEQHEWANVVCAHRRNTCWHRALSGCEG